MIIRALSRRSPYRRGGLVFDAALARGEGGRALVEIDQFTLRRIGQGGLRELVMDEAIELQFPPEVGRHAPPITAAEPPIAAEKPARKAKADR